jgi:hypothetical protein
MWTTRIGRLKALFVEVSTEVIRYPSRSYQGTISVRSSPVLSVIVVHPARRQSSSAASSSARRATAR